jgi:hypothetical protein
LAKSDFMKISRNLSYVASLIAALFGPAANAVTSYAQADTTIVQASPAESRFGWTFLNAGPGTQALITFALSSVVPPGTTAAGIKQAKLVLDIPTIQVSGSLQVTLLTSAFTESTAPGWSTRPAAAIGAAASTTFVLNQPLTYHYVDVTGLVRTALTSGLSTFTVAIGPSAATPSASALIWSRESLLINPAWTLSMPARLSIDLEAVATVSAATYFWATASSTYSCPATCPLPSVAAANAAGNVCKGADGFEYRSQQLGTLQISPGVSRTGQICGPNQWLAQCSCMNR